MNEYVIELSKQPIGGQTICRKSRHKNISLPLEQHSQEDWKIGYMFPILKTKFILSYSIRKESCFERRGLVY